MIRSEQKIGQIWTAQDHEHIVQLMKEVEKVYTQWLNEKQCKIDRAVAELTGQKSHEKAAV